jgi:hypothetical protein
MCLYAKYLANMTQVSDVAPGPLVLFIAVKLVLTPYMADTHFYAPEGDMATKLAFKISFPASSHFLIKKINILLTSKLHQNSRENISDICFKLS